MNPLRIFLLAALVLVVFSLNTGAEEKEPTWKYGGDVRGEIQISGDNNYIFTKTDSGLMQFNVDSFTPIWQLKNNNILDWDISKNGNNVITLNQTHLYYLDKETDESWQYSPPCYNILNENRFWDCLSRVSLSSDGKYISLLTRDKRDNEWDYDNNTNHYYSYNSTLYVFDNSSNVPIWSYEFPNSYFGERYYCCRDSYLLHTGDDKITVHLTHPGDDYEENYTVNSVLYRFDISNGNLLGNYTHYMNYGDGQANYFKTSSDGNFVTFQYHTNYQDFYLQVVEMTDFTKVRTFEMDNSVYSSDFSANGDYAVLCYGEGGYDQIYFLSTETEIPKWTYLIEEDQYKRAYCGSDNIIKISDDGKYVFVSHSFLDHNNKIGSRVLFFDVDVPEPLWFYEKFDSQAFDSADVIISGDGRYSAVKGTEILLFVTETDSYIECTHGQIKLDEDGFNQCVCNSGEWLCTDVECSADVSYNPDNGDFTDTGTPCETGDSKLAEDGCNQCVCNDGNWVCTEIDCAVSEDDEGLLPSISLLTSIISIGLLAIFRRK